MSVWHVQVGNTGYLADAEGRASYAALPSLAFAFADREAAEFMAVTINGFRVSSKPAVVVEGCSAIRPIEAVRERAASAGGDIEEETQSPGFDCFA